MRGFKLKHEQYARAATQRKESSTECFTESNPIQKLKRDTPMDRKASEDHNRVSEVFVIRKSESSSPKVIEIAITQRNVTEHARSESLDTESLGSGPGKRQER